LIHSDFGAAFPGHLIDVDDGVAFVPAPLPPPLDLPMATLRRLGDASHALGELGGVGRSLPNPHLLIGPFQRREAILSSQIEGTVATMEQLLLYEAAPTTTPSEAQEVANYVRALEYGLSRLSSLPISLRLVREMHEKLLRGVRGFDKRPGEFREIQNLVGRQGQSPGEARFVPPPPAEMIEALNNLETYIHAPSDIPDLVQLALVHYQFETIHPFLDGNGRMGRLLISLEFVERDLLPAPLLYLSAFFERNRDDYMDRLRAVSTAGRWVEWIDFFLEGIEEQSEDAVRRAREMLELRDQYRNELQTARSSALQLTLVDMLFERPVVTIPQAAERLEVTYRSAQLNVQKLVGAGVLRVVENMRPQLFVADAIVDVATRVLR